MERNFKVGKEKKKVNSILKVHLIKESSKKIVPDISKRFPASIPHRNNDLATIHRQKCLCGSFGTQVADYETLVEPRLRRDALGKQACSSMSGLLTIAIMYQKQLHSPVNLVPAPLCHGNRPAIYKSNYRSRKSPKPKLTEGNNKNQDRGGKNQTENIKTIEKKIYKRKSWGGGQDGGEVGNLFQPVP